MDRNRGFPRGRNGRRRLIDALLAYDPQRFADRPDPATRWPTAIWSDDEWADPEDDGERVSRRLPTATPPPLPTCVEDPAIKAAWIAYLERPNRRNKAALLLIAPDADGQWLIALGDALDAYPESRWPDVILGAPAPAAAEAATGIRQPGAPTSGLPVGRHGNARRPFPTRRRVAWPLAAVATMLLVAAVAAYAVVSRSPVAPLPVMTVAWHLAGEIDQPAWRVTPTATPSVTSVTVTCPDEMTCYAADPSVGAAVIETTDSGGAFWQAEPLPGVSLTSPLSCPTTERCVGLGDVTSPAGTEVPSAIVTSDGGATWSTDPLPATVGQVSDLDCPNSTACVGVGFRTQPTAATSSGGRAFAVTTTDGAAKWTVVPLPITFVPVTRGGVACTSAADCVLVGTDTLTTASHPTASTGDAMYTTDGGLAWSKATLPVGVGPFLAVSCSADRCLATADAVGASAATARGLDQPSVVLTTDSTGRSWTTAGGAGFAAWRAKAVSCPTGSDCWAAGWQLGTKGNHFMATILTTDNAGATWNSVPFPRVLTPAEQQELGSSQLTVAYVSSISCPATTSCVALGSEAGNSTEVVVLRS